MQSDFAIVGARILQVRKELKLSQSAFGDRAGLSQNAISEAESGKRDLRLFSLQSISQTYGVSLNWLILGIGPMWLKDSELPYQGNAIELLGRNCLITDAPDLVSILQNPELMSKLQLSADELHHLGDLIKLFGREARLKTREDWLKTIQDMRQVKLETIREIRELLKKGR